MGSYPLCPVQSNTTRYDHCQVLSTAAGPKSDQRVVTFIDQKSNLWRFAQCIKILFITFLSAGLALIHAAQRRCWQEVIGGKRYPRVTKEIGNLNNMIDQCENAVKTALENPNNARIAYHSARELIPQLANTSCPMLFNERYKDLLLSFEAFRQALGDNEPAFANQATFIYKLAQCSESDFQLDEKMLKTPPPELLVDEALQPYSSEFAEELKPRLTTALTKLGVEPAPFAELYNKTITELKKKTSSNYKTIFNNLLWITNFLSNPPQQCTIEFIRYLCDRFNDGLLPLSEHCAPHFSNKTVLFIERVKCGLALKDYINRLLHHYKHTLATMHVLKAKNDRANNPAKNNEYPEEDQENPEWGLHVDNGTNYLINQTSGLYGFDTSLSKEDFYSTEDDDTAKLTEKELNSFEPYFFENYTPKIISEQIANFLSERGYNTQIATYLIDHIFEEQSLCTDRDDASGFVENEFYNDQGLNAVGALYLLKSLGFVKQIN